MTTFKMEPSVEIALGKLVTRLARLDTSPCDCYLGCAVAAAAELTAAYALAYATAKALAAFDRKMDELEQVGAPARLPIASEN